jgi:hypothetical protein
MKILLHVTSIQLRDIFTELKSLNNHLPNPRNIVKMLAIVIQYHLLLW